ncbi:phosphatidate cytidylyltransferase, partial [Coemansia spiralis]
GYYRFQMGQFAWTHMALALVVTQSQFMIENIFEGIFWFFMPIALVIVNDIFAYVFGFFFGRHQLIELSPKKTWEGYIGGGLTTMVFGFVFTALLSDWNFMVCPPPNLHMTAFSDVQCDVNPVFVPRDYRLPAAISAMLSAALHRTITTVSIRPVQFHSLAISAFASLIAPFGGFFASGVKRAFNIKDFGNSIPGHGGVTDRFDCQFFMAAFSHMYYSSFIRVSTVTVGALFSSFLALDTGKQLELYQNIQEYLQTAGSLAAAADEALSPLQRMVPMSDAGFNDDELEKELFGGGSNDLDDLGGFGDADDSIASVPGIAGAVASPAADTAGGGSSSGNAAATIKGAGVEAKLKSARAPRLDIALDDPPGDMTVLTHPPLACRTAAGERRACRAYDILPTMAFLNPYQIYTIAATANMRWVFTGGEDGYIKRWDFNATVNGKQLLTQTQRHPYVDSVSKAGVMASYWDHSDTSETGADVLSPVYSMDVQSEAVWLVSGMKSGRIGLWTTRHDEGRRIALLDKHKGPVSVLRISPDEFGLVSGSWDWAVLYWDLNCGKLARGFAGHTSQISSIEFQPTWSDEQFQAQRGQSHDSDSGQFDSKHAAPVLMTTSIDGQCLLWDMRAPRALPHSFATPPKTPPWATAACWSRDGKRIY